MSMDEYAIGDAELGGQCSGPAGLDFAADPIQADLSSAIRQ